MGVETIQKNLQIWLKEKLSMVEGMYSEHDITKEEYIEAEMLLATIAGVASVNLY